MKANDRALLTAALRDHVGKIAADLRAKMQAPGDRRTRAQRLHADEQVGEDFDVWTDLLSRRAAVLWVLKSVYVRVLEDRGLLTPGRLLDQEAQLLFERLAPHLGETAFLRWVYRDLASSHGGLPELFSPQPAEVALPSDELSRALIAFWRHRDADTGAAWSFAEERFEGELMGDLYQELDPVVKSRFALCQTPEFVRAFILDRTLTPAIETFGAGEVRLLDPACGSGHFLIDGLKRLVAATSAEHPDWERAELVAHALDRVVGIDLNDYACALARTRLIMTAAEMAGVANLAAAARFHPHVYWADGLEQVEREGAKPWPRVSLFEEDEEKPRATLTRSDVRTALKKVFANKFHAVVANPPYITEKDAARKDYHREVLNGKQRYVSAYRKYSLGCPFTERCFQLAQEEGYIGLITSNNFMKREFGKPLIELILAGLDLTLVVDTSQAYIPFHGTPTVLLFGRNRRPESEHVRAVMGKRGESGTPADPAKGRVWSGIAHGWDQVGFEDDYVNVVDMQRETLGKHPWSLGGGGAAELKQLLQERCASTLGKLAVIGIGGISGADDVYVGRLDTWARLGVEPSASRTMVVGEDLRDWGHGTALRVFFPYDRDLRLLPATVQDLKSLWRWRTVLWARAVFGGGTYREAGRTWYEWHQLTSDRYRTALSIAFAEVATHNHFVLDRGGSVFKQTAPVIKLPAGATEDDHLALLGLLNSSTACFWMKQVFYPKGGDKTGDGGRRAIEDWHDRYAHDSTKMRLFPVVAARQATLPYARQLDALASRRRERSALQVVSASAPSNARDLRERLDSRRVEDERDSLSMVALQEELDWLCYALYGLDTASDVAAPEDIEPLPPTALPWCVTLAQKDEAIRAALAIGDPMSEPPTDWFTRHGWVPQASLPATLSAATRARTEARRARTRANPALALIETAKFKRRWYKSDYEAEEREALQLWLAERVETVAKERGRTSTSEQLVAALQDDPRVLAVCEVLTGRPDFSLTQVVAETLQRDAVPSHRFHLYRPSGLVKREVWERTWEDQRREDAGEKVTPEVPPSYDTKDFLRTEYWQLRGKLDVPKERFTAFTEAPGRSGTETLYGWAGWTALERLKAILGIDEELEDATVPLADRIGLLDSAWRLLPDVARDDAAAAARLRAELQALVGPEGPSRELIEDWKKRFPPPSARTTRVKRAVQVREEEDHGSEEVDES
jgi:hypothetical protein